jgi:putative membrane protein
MRVSRNSAAVALALATSLAAASAWAQSSAQDQAEAPNPTVKLTPSDEAFLSNEARSVIAQIQFGKLAQENGASPQVKKLGETMVSGGQADLGQLQGIAKASGVELPDEVQPSDQRALDTLKNLQGQTFDQEFRSRVEERERNEYSRLQLEATSATDPELQSYANKQMSTAQLMIDASKNIGVTEEQAPNECDQQHNQQPQNKNPQPQNQP